MKKQEQLALYKKANDIISQYRQRHKGWLIRTYRLSIPTAQWEQYMAWVGDFGKPFARKQRKLRKELTKEKYGYRCSNITATELGVRMHEFYESYGAREAQRMADLVDKEILQVMLYGSSAQKLPRR